MKTPVEVIEAASNAGASKAALSDKGGGRFWLLAVLAGIYIAMGGTLSVILGYGFPEITASNPSLQRLLSGAAFPLGLILVVILGAELFTGNNAVLMPSVLSGRISAFSVLKNWVLVYFGNFLGALFFTTVFVYFSGLTSSEPYHGAVQRIAEAKVSMPWGVVFIKGIAANWFVCLAVWLATTATTMPGKMIGCWFPVMTFVALGYEHSIANMFFIPIGIMEGASVTIHQFLIDNLVPATIGNIVGGALFVGTVYWYINKKTK